MTKSKSEESNNNDACDINGIWAEHRNHLRNFILKKVSDQDIAEDILQEVLIKMYLHCNSESGVRNIRSWLFQIAHNSIIDHYRKNSKIVTQDVFPDRAEESVNTSFQDAVNYIKPLINFLPEKYAVPLTLSDIEGIRQSEIAKKLNLSISATKSRIQRGRQLLKAEFVTCCTFETDSQGGILSFEIKDSCAPLQTFKRKLPK